MAVQARQKIVNRVVSEDVGAMYDNKTLALLLS